MRTFKIIIQRKFGESWPVKAELSKTESLQAESAEGTLELNPAVLSELVRRRQIYGKALGEALFQGDLLRKFDHARGQSEGRLRVLLEIDAPDLRGLRWDRLCIPVGGDEWDFLVLNQQTPFAHHLLSKANRKFARIGRLDLRALIVVACPEELDQSCNLPSFDIAVAVQTASESLGHIPYDVLARVDGSFGLPTLDQLCERLTAGNYTILHLVCHGQFQPDDCGRETFIFLEDAERGVARVTASDLIKRLKNLGELPHFAFLSTCESAVAEAEAGQADSPDTAEPLGGLAQRLVRDLGIKAVLAMTEKITVKTALALTKHFYRQLREHGEVDLALAEAAAGLADRRDVTTPALFSSLAGEPLFSPAVNRKLTQVELAHGLDRLKSHLPDRAPSLVPCFESLNGILRTSLEVNYDSLSIDAKRERDEALTQVDELCSEVVEISFRALAEDEKVPEYDNRAPFRGLYAFASKDREFFFGRESLTASLQAKLKQHPFLPVLGPSGSGKSSLVLAGLIPALQAADPTLRDLVKDFKPGSDPLARLNEALSQLPDHSGLIVVDQFEEIFTLCRLENTRREFLEQLFSLTKVHRVIITMRADFIGECASYAELKQEIQDHLQLIAPLDAEELGKAIVRQADVVKFKFESGVVQTILDDVQDEPGAMPLLQHALQELWNRRHGRWLQSEEYRAIGGVQQAIARTADDVYNQMNPVEQEQLREIFARLTRLDDSLLKQGERRDVRRRIALTELVPAESDLLTTKSLVQKLADARLVVTNENGEVEVAHESLLRHWPRLRAWLDEDLEDYRVRQAVGDATREWEQNKRDESFLLHRGLRLERARELFNHESIKLNEFEDAYVNACVVLQENERTVATVKQLRNLAEMGWGVIFAKDADPAVRDSLSELLKHRQGQAEAYYHELEYQPGETKSDFLLRYKKGSGAPDPEKVPHYLLIVGDPETIPFTFQYQLQVQYAVGRIHFDALEEYHNYAHSVVSAEIEGLALPRRLALYGPRFPNDLPTELSENLFKLLAEQIIYDTPDWKVSAVLAEEATKARLSQLIGGEDKPALLFTISYAEELPSGHHSQKSANGAIVCQDYLKSPGPRKFKPEDYFAANDLDDHAQMRGLIAFLWSRDTAGTPKFDDFRMQGAEKKEVAPAAFVAALAKRMLGHPRGGALAVIGRVGEAWTTSFVDAKGVELNLNLYKSALTKVMNGYPIGMAMAPFNLRYLELASEMTIAQEEAQPEEKLKDIRLAMYDARNFAIIGDPFVSVKV